MSQCHGVVCIPCFMLESISAKISWTASVQSSEQQQNFEQKMCQPSLLLMWFIVANDSETVSVRSFNCPVQPLPVFSETWSLTCHSHQNCILSQFSLDCFHAQQQCEKLNAISTREKVHWSQDPASLAAGQKQQICHSLARKEGKGILTAVHLQTTNCVICGHLHASQANDEWTGWHAPLFDNFVQLMLTRIVDNVNGSMQSPQGKKFIGRKTQRVLRLDENKKKFVSLWGAKTTFGSFRCCCCFDRCRATTTTGLQPPQQIQTRGVVSSKR